MSTDERIRSSKFLSSAPPVSMMPRSLMSAESSGGVRSSATRTALTSHALTQGLADFAVIDGNRARHTLDRVASFHGSSLSSDPIALCVDGVTIVATFDATNHRTCGSASIFFGDATSGHCIGHWNRQIRTSLRGCRESKAVSAGDSKHFLTKSS